MREVVNISIGLQHSLLNHLWQSTVIFFLVWGLSLCLKRQRANIRYALWLFASVKFLVPFSLLMQLGRTLRPAPIDSPNISLPQMSDVIIRSIQPYAASVQAGSIAPLAKPTLFPIAEVVGALFFVVWAVGTIVLITTWVRSWLKLYGTTEELPEAGLQGVM